MLPEHSESIFRFDSILTKPHRNRYNNCNQRYRDKNCSFRYRKNNNRYTLCRRRHCNPPWYGIGNNQLF